MVDTTFANLPDGFNLFALFDTAFAQTLACYAPNVVTSGAKVAISSTDNRPLLLNKTVGSATTVNLPAASTRVNQPVKIVDLKGDAASHNITIVPNGSEKIMGQSNLVIVSNYGGVTLWPIATGGWYQA